MGQALWRTLATRRRMESSQVAGGKIQIRTPTRSLKFLLESAKDSKRSEKMPRDDSWNGSWTDSDADELLESSPTDDSDDSMEAAFERELKELDEQD